MNLRTMALAGACLTAILAFAGCGAPSVPKATRQLRAVPVTSGADAAAADLADEASDRLQEWSDDAARRRERGEELPPDDPILDGRAAAEVARIGEEALAAARSQELRVMLESLARAQRARLEILARRGKFKAKRYSRANRKVVEIGFGLRQWRSQR